VLATGFGWLLVEGILSSLKTPVIAAFWQPQGMLGTLVMGLVSGLIVGATQWLVLRRYVPDWLWILANAAGYVLFMITLQGWRDLVFAGVVNLPLQNLSWLGGILGVLLATLCAFWLGFAQWLVLREYARHSWKWIVVPPLAVLLAFALFTGSLLLSQMGFLLPLHPGQKSGWNFPFPAFLTGNGSRNAGLWAGAGTGGTARATAEPGMESGDQQRSPPGLSGRSRCNRDNRCL
jgi:hypothetical protein